MRKPISTPNCVNWSGYATRLNKRKCWLESPSPVERERNYNDKGALKLFAFEKQQREFGQVRPAIYFSGAPGRLKRPRI
jgi:hypothetical protein